MDIWDEVKKEYDSEINNLKAALGNLITGGKLKAPLQVCRGNDAGDAQCKTRLILSEH